MDRTPLNADVAVFPGSASGDMLDTHVPVDGAPAAHASAEVSAPTAVATPAPRPVDHLVIDRLSRTLVPALISRLSAGDLGEIEIRREGWKLRVRRPAAGQRRPRVAPARREAGSRSAGPALHRLPSGMIERRDRGDAGRHAGNGSGGPRAAPEAENEAGPGSVMVTSPAVGVYQPRKGLATGSRVRNGDRIGAVDVLGVPQEVVAPVDGVLGEGFVEAGQAVEYGQEIIRIEAVLEVLA